MPVNDAMLSGITADLLSLYDVKRWGVIRISHQQSVAEHSFGVAVIAMELLCRLAPDYIPRTDSLMGDVLRWALVHDMPECLTADIDGRFKRNHPVLREAIREAESVDFPEYAQRSDRTSRCVKAIVKLADCVETISYVASRGQGARAVDVVAELQKVLWDDLVPRCAADLKLTTGTVEGIVRVTLHRVLSESCGYQFRTPWSVPKPK